MVKYIRYLGIFLVPFILNIILFYYFGSFGLAKYVNGLVMMFGLILNLQLSFIIFLLVYLADLLKNKDHTSLIPEENKPVGGVYLENN